MFDVCIDSCTDGYGDLENLIQEYDSRLVQLHHTIYNARIGN